MQQTLRRPRPMRPPVSIHMMPDFSAYDSCDAQSVSAAITSGTAQPVSGGPFYSHKSLKRKRSESTDSSDDPEERDYNYHHTRHPTFGCQYPVAECGYAPAKSDERGHLAKRARLADDFAELRLRGQSLSPTSGISPAPVPLWARAPVIEGREGASPRLPMPPLVEIDLTDEYAHVRHRRSAGVAPFESIPPEIDVDITPAGILRGEVEEVVSPGVLAERSRSKTTTADGNEHDTRMHGTSSYEPEKDRIIITDLDDFSDSDGESSTTPPLTSTSTPTSTPYKISSAYLSRFGNIPRAEFEFEDLGDVDDRQALITYRPLVQTINAVPSRPKLFRGYIEEVEDGVVGSPPTVHDADADEFVVEPYPEDAMDIDME